MFFDKQELQVTTEPDRSDPLFARRVQELLGGQYGEVTVAMQYAFQGWGEARSDVGGRIHHGRMSALGPSIDEILIAFFAREQAGTSGSRSDRLERVELTLRDCLESDCDHVLDDGGASLLAAERVFEPAGAFARSLRADDLVFALVVVLEDRWLPDDPGDRRLQVRIALRLVDFLLERRLIDDRDLACPLIELKVRASRVRAALRAESATADR